MSQKKTTRQRMIRIAIPQVRLKKTMIIRRSPDHWRPLLIRMEDSRPTAQTDCPDCFSTPADGRNKICLRLPYGGVYMDNEQCAEEIADYLPALVAYMEA